MHLSEFTIESEWFWRLYLFRMVFTMNDDDAGAESCTNQVEGFVLLVAS
jgi:hypothetical protein